MVVQNKVLLQAEYYFEYNLENESKGSDFELVRQLAKLKVINLPLNLLNYFAQNTLFT